MSQDHAGKINAKAVKADRKPPRTTGSKPAPRPTTPAPRAPGAAAPATPPPRAPPRDGCLVCKGAHWPNDCPTATEAQRTETLKKFREDKEHRASASRSKAARYKRSAMSVCINGLLTVPYVPDTGADRSIIPEGVVTSFRAVQPTLSPILLSTPVEAEMADGRRLRCDQELLLDLALVTMAGQVSLRSVSCLVRRGDGDELLLGRDVLKGLGIDVEEQLAQLAEPALLDSENDEFSVDDELPFAPQPINSLDELLGCAVGNGLPEEHVGTVRALLDEFPDIWRDAVGADLPADVEPLRVTLRPDAVPHRSAPRKYAPLQAAFIRDYVKALVDDGLIEQNNSARWACAVVPVRKPGTQDKFRLTIDYRPVNSVTVPIAGTMPSAAIQTDAFQGKKVFARFDFTQGFWQLPLHEDSREIFSFVTPDGVYTPTRVPQGAMDSAMHFQSQVEAKLAPLIPHSALVWVDDVILFAPTIAEFLQTLRTFLEIVSAANFKFNRTKSSLFELEIF
ncbi:unnamed protein product [Phytophthora fragariaefolia]|uniref:Unnamed protein product n=1 Tax=Phytophthora fragariaefolia TaxID=1490495 RepID=A0A9W7DBC9_9STRA|nr:unnamed protein product [Phytophthora fragariaefolia]